MPIKEDFMAFLDTETTGVVPGRDEVLEIATIITDMKLREVARFDKKIIVTTEVRPEVAAINGFDKEVWAREAVPFQEWKNFIKTHVPFGSVAVPVGHNVRFDDDMIRKRYYPQQFCPLSYHNVDTCALATLARTIGILDVPNVKLITVAAALGIATDKAHRAMGDVEMVMAIFKHYGNILIAGAIGGKNGGSGESETVKDVSGMQADDGGVETVL